MAGWMVASPSEAATLINSEQKFAHKLNQKDERSRIAVKQQAVEVALRHAEEIRREISNQKLDEKVHDLAGREILSRMAELGK